ncbi:MAG: hypothetical protein Q8P05_03260 [Candidatus Diapherotrites archaeon]|nr:hypothetical protein [Candidatus Diapherotrites archaeon]
MPYVLKYYPGWDKYFDKMDRQVQERIWKKIQQQKEETSLRHLNHGIEFSVLEIGQYRVALKIVEKTKEKEIRFSGNHKQYEKWYKNLKKKS